ncbi:MAG: glycosyltransferase family 4 protein [Chitinispirillaceae bacterium]
MRLFSYGYRSRGIGTFVKAFTKAFVRNAGDHDLTIWGNRDHLPDHLSSFPVIDYREGNWRSDLVRIPALINQNKIDLVHHWVVCGPIWRIGLGIAHVCRSVSTVYDMGVQLWDDPYLKAVKNSFYWRTQCFLVRKADRIMCISEATRSDLEKVISSVRGKTEVLYVPVDSQGLYRKTGRKPFFVALGGSSHKNLRRVVEAFCRFRKTNPQFRLVVCGQIENERELPEDIPEGIDFASMEEYPHLLKKASGLLFCSLYEGLGLPPLEAMGAGCPLLLSRIPVLSETCSGAGVFVDPHSTDDIRCGMEKLAHNVDCWSDMSCKGNHEYKKLSGVSVQRLADMYMKLGK